MMNALQAEIAEAVRQVIREEVRAALAEMRERRRAFCAHLPANRNRRCRRLFLHDSGSIINPTSLPLRRRPRLRRDQPAGGAPLPRKPGQDPAYKLRDLMTAEEIAYNVAQMRKASKGLADHADALEAWDAHRWAAE